MRSCRLQNHGLILGAVWLAGVIGCGKSTEPVVPAAAVAVFANPNTAVAGSALTELPAVRITTSSGAPVPGIAVTFAVTSGGGSITGSTQNTNSDGLATVGSWTLGPIAGANVLTATAPNLPPVVFTVTGVAGPPTKLVVTSAPSATAPNRQAFATQPVVQLQDVNGNAVSQGGTAVTVSIVNGGGALSGTTTASTAGNGAASFTDLTIAGATGARTLSFASTGLSTAEASVSITAGAATTLALNAGDGQTAIAGSSVQVRPAVKATDADDNPVPNLSVTFAVASGGGGVAGPTQTTNANGIATVSDWSLGATAGTKTLTATSAGLTGSPVTFTATAIAGPAAKLAVSTLPTATPVNRAVFPTQPVVQLRDVNSNDVAQAGTTISVAITSGNGTLFGTATAVTSSTGAATFTNLSVGGSAGTTQRLSFTASTLTSASADIATTTGPAAIITAPGGTTRLGIINQPVNPLPAVRVTDLDGNQVSGVPVAFAVTSGGGSLSGADPVTTAGGSAAVSWTLGPSTGANAMTATSAALTGSPITFTATAELLLVSSISPSVMVPGASAVITGQGFSTTGLNVVNIDGQTATVNSATNTSIDITLPTTFSCVATHDANVQVSVGSASASKSHPLRVATQRTLAVGQSIIITAPGEIRCNELSTTGGLYYVNVYNTSTTYSTTGASFELKGTPATGAAAADPAVTPVAPIVTASHSDERKLAAAMPSMAVDEGQRLHFRVLEENRRIMSESGRDLRARLTSRANLRSMTAAVPTVGDMMTLRIPNINSSNFCNSYYEIIARVAYVGTRAIIVEDQNNQLYNQIDSTYAAIGSEFDNTMFGILETNYGNPLAMDALTDNNGRIVMVFSRVVNDNIAAAGFVVSCDFFPRSTYAQSNFGEYFYATVPTVSGNIATTGSPPHWRWLMRGTIIHEAKHITSFGERIARSASTQEESWLEETTARMSEELYERSLYAFTQRSNIGYGSAGNPVGPYCGVRACGGKPFGFVRTFDELATNWYVASEDHSPLGKANASDFSFYSTGWSLVRWAIDNNAVLAESAILKGLTQETTKSGVANLEAHAGIVFADALPRWTFAMVLDDHPVGAANDLSLKQPSWNLRSVFQGLRTDFPSVYPTAWPLLPFSRSFGNFTVSYHVLPGTASITELSGTQSAKQLIELKASGSSAAAPAELKIAIVRLQ